MSFLPGRRIGFWVADDDIYGAEAIFGNAAGTVATPQQFFQAYFNTPPYPAAMVWTGGLYSSASHSVPPAQEAEWFNELLSICDQYPNIKIWMIAFVNVSGFSVVGGVRPPAASTGLVNTGFTIAHAANGETSFTIAATAGLLANTTYTLQLLDNNLALIGNITSFTTDSTGTWSGIAGVPNTTDAQANNGGYIVVQGTHVGTFTGWQNDQQADLAAYMNAISGHQSFVGALFEPEYFGNNATILATFKRIVNAAGYLNLVGSSPGPGDATISYSSYPYFSGVLYTGTASPTSLGVHYGETGGPIAPDPMPIWTATTVLNIVHNSEVAPVTIVIAFNDVNNPLATAPAYQNADGSDWYLYMSPAFRAVIANDAYYQANYITSTGVSQPPPPAQRSNTKTILAVSG